MTENIGPPVKSDSELISDLFQLTGPFELDDWQSKENQTEDGTQQKPPYLTRELIEKTDNDTIFILCLTFPETLAMLRERRLSGGPFEVNLVHKYVKLEKRKLIYDRYRDHLQCFEFLKSIFEGNLESLTFAYQRYPFLENKEYLREVKRLRYRDHPYDDLSAEACLKMLDKFPNVEDFIGADQRFIGEKFYNIDHVEIETAFWMTPEILKSMKNKTIRITENIMSIAQIQQVVIDWQDGKYPNLEMFSIQKPNKWTKEMMLEGLSYQSFDKNNRCHTYLMPKQKPNLPIAPPYYPFTHHQRKNGIELRDAVDVVRKGKDQEFVASILITTLEFVFLVWKDPYPCIPMHRMIKHETLGIQSRVLELQRRNEECSKLELQAKEMEEYLRLFNIDFGEIEPYEEDCIAEMDF